MTTAEPTPDTEQQQERAQDFLVFLAGTNKGRTAAELTSGLQGLVAAILDTGKGGTLTYKLSIKPIDPAEQGGPVKVVDEIVVKLPTHDRPTSIFFVDENRNLVRHNPHQRTLFEG